MDVMTISEFIAAGAKQFEWFEYGEGEALTRLRDQEGFYLNKEMPIAVPIINPRGEFEEEEFWYSIVHMSSDMIHVHVLVNNIELRVEINDLENKVHEAVSNLSESQSVAAGY